MSCHSRPRCRASSSWSATSGARWSLFVTFAEGMEELIRALAHRLPPDAVRLKEAVTGISREGARWRLVTAADVAYTADAVVLAPESHQVARMTRYLDPALAHLLEGIPYASSATVTLAYRRAAIPHPLAGFGFVVPLFARVGRYVKAMPQYHVGHLARVEAIEDALRRHRGLVLAGGAYRGVGIADCIRSAEEGAVRALESLSQGGS